MSQIVSHARALWDSDWVWRLLLVAGVTYATGWIGFVVGAGFIVVSVVWEARAVTDDATCAKCTHLKDDHHGNCQACLRDELQGTLTGDVPCSRFARGSAESLRNS